MPGLVFWLLGTAALAQPPTFEAPTNAHASDLLEFEDGWVLAYDGADGPEWTSHLARLDRAGRVLAYGAVASGLGPRIAFSGSAFAVAFFRAPIQGGGSSAVLRLVDADLKRTPVAAELGPSATATAVTWHPRLREWAVAISEHAADGVAVRISRHAEHDLALRGSIDLGKVPRPDYSPSGVFSIFPHGRGYRMVIYPALAVVDWDGEGVRTSASLHAPPSTLAAVRVAGDALWIASAEPHRPVAAVPPVARETSSTLWLTRVERGEATIRIQVAKTQPPWTVRGVALYAAPTGHEVIWTEREDGSGAILTRSTVIAHGNVRPPQQVTRFDVRHWAQRSGGVSATKP